MLRSRPRGDFGGRVESVDVAGHAAFSPLLYFLMPLTRARDGRPEDCSASRSGPPSRHSLTARQSAPITGLASQRLCYRRCGRTSDPEAASAQAVRHHGRLHPGRQDLRIRCPGASPWMLRAAARSDLATPAKPCARSSTTAALLGSAQPTATCCRNTTTGARGRSRTSNVQACGPR